MSELLHGQTPDGFAKTFCRTDLLYAPVSYAVVQRGESSHTGEHFSHNLQSICVVDCLSLLSVLTSM